MRAFSPAAPLVQFLVPSQNWKRGLTPFMQHKRFPRFLLQLERNPKVPTKTREEPCVPHLIWRWGQISLHCLESSPEFPLKTQKEA